MTVATDFRKGYVSYVEAIASSSTLSSINNSTLEEERLSIGPFRPSSERIGSELHMTNHYEYERWLLVHIRRNLNMFVVTGAQRYLRIYLERRRKENVFL